MPQEPQNYPDPYAQMGTGERLAELAKGLWNIGKYTLTEPSATWEHLDSPEVFARMLRERYPELGKQRVNRGALDAAINFAGGYDWAMRPEVNPEDARTMALQYQLLDYMKPGRKGSDEAADYAQNMAGVEQALVDRAKRIKREREDIAALARQYAQQEAEQGRVKEASGAVDPERQRVMNEIRQTPWFSNYIRKHGQEPDLSENADYDYFTAWTSGARPDKTDHWPSYTADGKALKMEGHPTLWKTRFMDATGIDPDTIGIKNEQEAQAYLQQRRVKKAQGGAVNEDYDPARVQSIVDRLNVQFMAEGGRPKLPADRATGFKQPGAAPDDRLARFGSSFVSSLPGAASNVATGYVDMLSALNTYLYQLEPAEQIALLKQLPAGLRDMVLKGVEFAKQIPEKVAAATPESAGQFGAQLTAEMLLDPVRVGKGAPKTEIMKSPGGNWEAGSVERIVDRLRPRGPKNRDEALAANDEGWWARGEFTQQVEMPEFQDRMRQNAAISDWLDKKLKNYIKNDMATERDPVRLGIEQRLARAEEEKAKADLRNAKKREKISAARAQGKNTTAAERQLEQDIADAEQDYRMNQTAASHMQVDQARTANAEPSETLMDRRVSVGAPPENLATTDLSAFWEKQADYTLGVIKNAGDAVSPNFWLEPRDYERFVQNNPWALKVPPNTKIYSILPNSEQALQFDHLRHEIDNALYDRVNLPPELRLTPEDLSKMSMDAAVAHVGKMNAWRERNKVAADLLRSRNAATVTFKEYPEAGLEWKELKMPTDQVKDVEKMVRQIEGKYSILPPGERLSWKDPASGRVLFETPEKAIQAYSSNANRSVLEEALGYEGDVMGHCVGGRGYCDEIISGTGRIFSLRDAKGEPHVTIQVRPGGKKIVAEYDEEELRRAAESQSWELKDAGDPREIEEIYDEVYQQLRPEFASYGDETNEILQIKGKGNLRPADKYIPFVDDFVRSQQFANVRDLDNTGLIDLTRMRYFLRPGEEDIVNSQINQGKKFITKSEWDEMTKDLPPIEGRATGGAVSADRMGYNAAAVDAIVRRLSEKFNG